MELLEQLRTANPSLRLYSVLDPEFSRYGRVLTVSDPTSLSAALEQTPIPETGNIYQASDADLEALDCIHELARTVYGGMPVQAGFCNGRGYQLNAEEYHKCSEVNYTTTGLVLLLALHDDIRNGKLDAGAVKGFCLPPGIPVEIYPLVLHFAPCRIRESGFNCLVVLARGTNAPLPSVNTAASGEEAMLWMVNKWMLCHPDSPQAAKGAYIGITGENLSLRLPFLNMT